MACTAVSDPVHGHQVLMFRIHSDANDYRGNLLLEAAGCSRTYEWSEGGRNGSLVVNVNWCGDTLVIDLTPFHQMRAWPGGDGLVSQTQALLRCLRAEPQH